MSEPLGRDRLGRLVYEDDLIFPDNTMSDGDFIVCLNESPKHTNYERYFADLGGFSEIHKAVLFMDYIGDPVIRDFLDAITDESGECFFAGWLDEVAMA